MELIKNNLTIYPSLVISDTEKETSAVCWYLRTKRQSLQWNSREWNNDDKCTRQELLSLVLRPPYPIDKYSNGFDYEKQCLQAMIQKLPDKTIIIGGQLTADRLNHSAPPSPSVLLLESQENSKFMRLSQMISY